MSGGNIRLVEGDIAAGRVVVLMPQHDPDDFQSLALAQHARGELMPEHMRRELLEADIELDAPEGRSNSVSGEMKEGLVVDAANSKELFLILSNAVGEDHLALFVAFTDHA